MKYWMVRFESYVGHGNAVAWFETKEAAETVYDAAVSAIRQASARYNSSAKHIVWSGVLFSVEDCFGTKFTINLSNHVIALNDTDTSNEATWKTWRANKDAGDKYKQIYEGDTKTGFAAS